MMSLADGLGISRVTATVLVNRGITTTAGARSFLSGQPEEASPALLTDLTRAVARIKQALERRERIMVFGDYDVDGVAACVLLVDALRRLGGHVDYYIPHRSEEGYGLNPEVIERAVREGYTLGITVDCGIAAGQEVEQAASQGLEFIITDHHQPPDVLPRALAVINPHRPGSAYPFPDLAGVGVAFKLLQGLAGTMPGRLEPEQYLDLVCLGTVADVVPLLGENRYLVREGLKRLAAASRIGIRELMRVANINPEKLTVRDISHILAPRLNAAGRLEHAGRAAELLLTEDPSLSVQLARELQDLNAVRQSVEQKVFAEAVTQVVENDFCRDQVLVLAGSDWHPGVIGIVAARLVERFSRPVVMLAKEQDIARGSARSVPGFDLVQALETVADLCLKAGGHQQAAGLEIPCDLIPAFRERLNRYASGVVLGEPAPQGEIDAEVAVDEINDRLLHELEQLAPFGAGNPQPLFLGRGYGILRARAIGTDRSHLKLTIQGKGGTILDGIAFGLGRQADCLHRKADFVFCLERNSWNGQEQLQLTIKDLAPLPARAEYDSNKAAAALLRETVGTSRAVSGALEITNAGAVEAAAGTDGMPGTAWFDRSVWEQIRKGVAGNACLALQAVPGRKGRNRVFALAAGAARVTNRLVLLVAPFRGMAGRLHASLECTPLAAQLPLLKAHPLSPPRDRKLLQDRLQTGGASIGIISKELLGLLGKGTGAGSPGLLIFDHSCFLAGDGRLSPELLAECRRQAGEVPILVFVPPGVQPPDGFTLLEQTGDGGAATMSPFSVTRCCAEDRYEHVARMVQAGNRVLLSVRTGIQARQVADRLRSLLEPATGITVAASYPELAPSRRNRLEAALTEGSCRLVVAAGSMNGPGLQAESLVFWSPPLSLAALCDQAGADGCFNEVIWLSDAEELSLNRSMVRAWAPEPAELLQFREALFRGTSGEVVLGPADMSFIQIPGPGGIRCHPGRVWLEILMELDLVRGEIKEGRYHLNWGVNEAVDWSISTAYREGQIELAEWERVEAVLEGDEAERSCFFRQLPVCFPALA